MADNKTILTQKLIDLEGLRVFWGKTKDYVDGKISEVNLVIEENERVTSEALNDLNGRLNDVAADVAALGAAEGGIQGMIDATIAGLDLPNKYDAKGAADKALTDAKAYADGLNNAMDARVKNLEAIDHAQLAADASAAAVATVLDGAPEKFDTLKEVAQWIADSESAADAADLVTRVKALEDIDHDAYKAADTALETSLKGYVDGKVDGKFDAAGAADQALTDAKKYADDNFVSKTGYVAYSDAEKTKLAGIAEGAQVNVIESVVVNGVPATIAGKTASVAVDCYTKNEVDTKLSAKANAADVYTKTEADNAFDAKGDAAQALVDAKAYTDELGKIVKGVYTDGKLTTDGHAQRIEALEAVAIASDDEINALFA